MNMTNIANIANQQATGKRFATVRFHDGYDIEEVDRCLDELDELVSDLKLRESVLQEANGLLRYQIQHANQRAEAAEAELERLRAEGHPPLVEPVKVEVETVPDAAQTTSRAAARLLEIATSESESLVEEARAEAAQLLAEARADADRLAQSTLAEVEARHEELAARQAEVEQRLTAQERDAQERVDQLLEVEAQCRTHLVSFFQAQLDELGRPTLAETVEAGEVQLPLAVPSL